MKAQLVELRIRGQRKPFRFQLGVATSRAELKELEGQRDVLRRLHTRGDFDVLEAVKVGRLTAAQVERLVDEWGLQDYKTHLEVKPPAEVPTLAQHSDAWLETIEKEGTRGVYWKGIRHLRDFEVDEQRLGDRPWHQVARHTIRDAKASLKLASNTVRTVMASWSGFYTWAIEREWSEAEEQGRGRLIESNPVRAAKAWSPIEITRHRFLTWAEFQRLLSVSPEPMRAQYATLTLAGLRVGELLNLPPAHVHAPTHLHVGPWGGWVPKGYPRSKHVVRDVPLHRDLALLLKEYVDCCAGDRTFFVNPLTGDSWKRNSFVDRLQKDVEAAGMVFGQMTREKGRTAEGVTAHTFRHTLASWLAQEDVQLMKIAAIMGDTVETVERHYAHLLPKDLDQALNRIGAVPQEKGG